MRLNTLTCAVLALALAAPTLAVAQGPGQRNDRGDGDGRYARPDSGPGYTPPMISSVTPCLRSLMARPSAIRDSLAHDKTLMNPGI